MLGNHRELSLAITETYIYAEKLVVLVENVKKDQHIYYFISIKYMSNKR